jgi:SAM-dependent methyltransferase
MPPTIILAEEQRLVRLDEARRALATARSLPEVKQIRDMAAALAQYAKQQQYSLQVQNDAAELKLRAERKAGDLLREMALNGGDRKSLSHDERVKLADLGISHNDSHRWQQEATVPAPVFEAYVTTTKERGKELTSRGVYELARDTAKAEVRRANTVAEQAPLDPDVATLLCGDFQTCGASVPDGSVDVIITDPPYEDDWLPQLDALGALAARVLKPGGSLLLLYGQYHLRQALETLDRHLTYHWPISYRLYGHASAIWSRKVQVHWKPCLWYVKGTYTGGMIGDVVECGPVPEKAYHDHQQSEEAFRQLVQRFSAPGDLILDPCCGSGTTGVAALQLRRRFMGIERDAGALAQVRARLAAVRGEDQDALPPSPPCYAQVPLSEQEATLMAAIAQTETGLTGAQCGVVLGTNPLDAGHVLKALARLRLVTRQGSHHQLRQKESV